MAKNIRRASRIHEQTRELATNMVSARKEYVMSVLRCNGAAFMVAKHARACLANDKLAFYLIEKSNREHFPAIARANLPLIEELLAKNQADFGKGKYDRMDARSEKIACLLYEFVMRVSRVNEMAERLLLTTTAMRTMSSCTPEATVTGGVTAANRLSSRYDLMEHERSMLMRLPDMERALSSISYWNDMYIGWRRQLAEINLPLIGREAKRYLRFGILKYPDLIQEGTKGMMAGADRFNPVNGAAFSTYVTPWIRHCLFEAVQSALHSMKIPSTAYPHMIKLFIANKHLVYALGRDPSADELIDDSGMSPDHVQMFRQQAPVSLHAHLSADKELIETVGEECETEDDGSKENLANALEELTFLERQLIRMRFGLGDGYSYSPEQISSVFGISWTVIKELEETAMDKLKSTLYLINLLETE